MNQPRTSLVMIFGNEEDCFATMGPEPKTTSILEPLPTEMLASEFGEMIRECR